MLRYALPLLALLAAAGCADSDFRIPEQGSTSIFPSAGDSSISTVGGHAAGLPGRSAGNSGFVSVSAVGGTLRFDDGRDREVPANNLLSGPMMDDSVVEYAELAAALPPVMVGNVATFSLGAQGLFLGSNSKIDLSDAPLSVMVVELLSDAPIRLDGDVRTSRPMAPAVGIRIFTTHTSGLAVGGDIIATATHAFAGGEVNLAATNGHVLATGRIRTNGGPATVNFDGGRGGNVSLSAGAGDVVLRAGTWAAQGLEGYLNGGNGGDIVISSTGAAATSFRWNMRSTGGRGVNGSGGDAGGVQVDIDGELTWNARIDAGAGSGPTAGVPAFLALTADTQMGALRIVADGGHAAGGAGGSGATLELHAGSIANFGLEADLRGGGSGGHGGFVTVTVAGPVSNSGFVVRAYGAADAAQGGNGGSAYLLATGVGFFEDVEVEADVRGGGSANQGGQGGGAGVNATADLAVTELLLQVDARGGNGAQGGLGGTAELATTSGAVAAKVIAQVDGGMGSTGQGGAGGVVNVTVADGAAKLDVDTTANGGRSTGGMGGPGGTITIGSAAVGSTQVWGAAQADGGNSGSGYGGAGGVVAITGGVLGLESLALRADARGGEGSNGGTGGAISWISGGWLLVHGGTSSAIGGAGDAAGGNGGAIMLTTTGAGLTLDALLIARGGTGELGGSGGSVTLNSDSDSTGNAGNIVHAATINVEGGHNGGQGGVVEILGYANEVGGTGGSIVIDGSTLARGGRGGTGGQVVIGTNGAFINIAGHVNATGGADGGSGGSIDVLDAQMLQVEVTARLIANGLYNGLAGTITLDPQGTGPANPNLQIAPGARLQTYDGSGVDRSSTNIVLD